MPNKFQQIVFIGKTLNLCFMQKVPILLQNFVLVGRLYLYGIQGTEKGSYSRTAASRVSSSIKGEVCSLICITSL